VDKGYVKATDYLFSVIAGNLIISATAKPIELLEIEGVAGLILILILLLVARYDKTWAMRLFKGSVTGVRWIVAAFAGTIFGVLYNIINLQWWPAGVLALGLFFTIVVLGIRAMELRAGSIMKSLMESLPQWEFESP
jgi:hypothetical protein